MHPLIPLATFIAGVLLLLGTAVIEGNGYRKKYPAKLSDWRKQLRWWQKEPDRYDDPGLPPQHPYFLLGLLVLTYPILPVLLLLVFGVKAVESIWQYASAWRVVRRFLAEKRARDEEAMINKRLAELGYNPAGALLLTAGPAHDLAPTPQGPPEAAVTVHPRAPDGVRTRARVL